MGNFSRDTFDGRKGYASVRLQQGVPLVDADWNEREDVRRAELRNFARAFAGSGVPRGSDGFRVTPAAGPNDFGIAAGRCLVEGWEVVNDWDERGDAAGRSYTSQPLFGDGGLAAAWGVDPLPALTTPGSARTDRVYLDVWEREVDADEDPELVDPQLGVEGCVRIRREWVVRVAEGAAELPAAPAGHAFYELALLHRRAGGDDLPPEQVEDRRRTGLCAVSQNQLAQITADAFGPGYTLDGDGEPNLKVSLREAVNALMRGQLLGAPPRRINENTATDSLNARCALTDRTGAVWVFWAGYSIGQKIWYRRYDPVTGTWDAIVQLTHPGDGDDGGPVSVVEDGDGSIWVFWTRTLTAGGSAVLHDRYDPAGRAWRGEAELRAASTAGDSQAAALVDSRGDVRVFWRRGGGSTGALWHNRFDRTSRSWVGEAQLTAGTANDDAPSAVMDGRGDLWVVWTRAVGTGKRALWCNRYDPMGGTWTGEVQLATDAASNVDPYAVVGGDGAPWVFWTSDRGGNTDVYYRRYDGAGGTWAAEQRLTSDAGYDSQPAAVTSGEDLWVFWTSRPGGPSQPSVLCRRYTSDVGWGSAMQVSTGEDQGRRPVPFLDSGGDIWIAMEVSPPGHNSDIWYRRLVTAI